MPHDDVPKTRVMRHAERGRYDRATIESILDEALICHVGFADEQQPYVIPMAFARVKDEVVLHGSAKSRLMQKLASGTPICVTVSLIDGLVLARSAFHHSMNYRSVMLFGRPRLIGDEAEKKKALQAIVEHLVPGRISDVRAPSEKEAAVTSVIALKIDQSSAKMRSGPPTDAPADIDSSAWAGEIPLVTSVGLARPAPDLRDAIDPPRYVSDYRRPS